MRKGSLLVGLALAMTAVGTVGAAEPDRSHVHIKPDFEDQEGLEKLIRDRFLQSSMKSLVSQMKPEDMKTVLDALKNNPNPNLQGVKEFFKPGGQGNGKLPQVSAQQLKALQDLLKTLPVTSQGPHPTVTPPQVTAPPVRDPRLPPEPNDLNDDEAYVALNELLKKYGKDLDGLMKYLKDSPGLQQMVRDLAAAGQNGGESNWDWGNFKSIAKVGNWLDRHGMGLKDWNLPVFDAPSINISKPNVGAGGLPSARSAAEVGKVIVGVGLLVVVALVFFKMKARQASAAMLAAGEFDLGPWPVAPGQVASREDMIRSFEYLGLRDCGPLAMCWNHLEVAQHLAGAEHDRQEAAALLARGYEWARYAPEQEPLSNDLLTAYRRNLCFLAGEGLV